jgi:flagellar M-ring protein FliF
MQPFSAIFASLRQTLTALPPGRRLALLATGIASIALVAGLVYWSNQVDYGVLYSGLSSEDAGAVVQRLQEKKIPYKISPSGETVSAPADRIPELRMELASAGLPRGGHVGYEIFDQKSLGATEFEQQLNYRRALRGSSRGRSTASTRSSKAASTSPFPRNPSSSTSRRDPRPR